MACGAAFTALSILPIDKCDLLAASQDDDFRIGPGNDARIFAAFYKDAALAACRSAVARNRTSGSWLYGRYLYQLSRIPHDGDVEEGAKAALELHYPAAYNGLGYIYLAGEGVPGNLKLSNIYFSAAVKLGNVSSLVGVADVARKLGDRQAEYDNLVDYKNKGGRRLYHLALFYKGGFPPKIPNPDVNTYIKLLALSVDHGDALSAAELAYDYWDGYGVPPDQPYACKLYEKAIRYRAYARAAGSLAITYRAGGCGKQDLEKATYWAIFGAKFKDPYAFNTLLELMSSGQAKFPAGFDAAGAEFQIGESFEKKGGVSLTEAIDWYKKAAALGNQSAKDALKRLKVSD